MRVASGRVDLGRVEPMEPRRLLSTVSFPGDMAVDGGGNTFVSAITQQVQAGASGVIDEWGNSVLHVIKFSSGGKRLWEYQVDLGTTSGAGGALAVDATGNIYVTGQFASQVRFDPKSASTSLTSSGGNDVFVLKLSPAGLVGWVRQFGGKQSDRASGIAIGSSGNVFVSGSFSGVAQLGRGAGSVRLTSAGGRDAFVLGLSADGKTISAQRFGGRGDDSANSLAFTPAGGLLVGGDFEGTMAFGGQVPALRSSGHENGWVAQIGSGGKAAWAKRIGGTGYESVQKLAVGTDGDIWVAGAFEDDKGFGSEEKVSAAGTNGSGGMFVGRYDSSMNLRWQGTAGDSSQSAGAMAVDGGGNTYLTMEYGGTAAVWSRGPQMPTTGLAANVVVAKVDPAGNLLWVHAVGGKSYDDAWALGVDSSNDVRVLGGEM
ncbi:MAG: hypothetical protein ACHRHE_23230, partial [Tepidisphaerales bacterium]